MIENEVRLSGRLVNKPHLFSTSTGKSRVFFCLACGKKDHVEFISCTAWDKVAENMDAYTDKGMEISVSGHLISRSKEINNKIEYYLECVVDEVKFHSGKRKEKEEPKNEAFKTLDDEILELDADNLPF